MRGTAQKSRTALGNIAQSGQVVTARRWPCAAPCGLLPPRLASHPLMRESARVERETPQFTSNKKKEVQHITSESHEDEFTRTERFQISQGRVIRVVSVFPKQGTETPEDKLKALAELEFQQGKLCA